MAEWLTAAVRAASRVLTDRELNRALLARQLLLERATTSIPEVLEQVAGLQAQSAPASYVGLWTRLQGFRRDDLTDALQDRTVVQGTLMRTTIHLVSARDYWPFAAAVRAARRAWWLRVQPDDVKAVDMAAAARRVRRKLRQGPMRRIELDHLVGKPAATGVGLWVDMVRVPPSGTWERRRADLYGLAEEWIPPVEVPMAEAVEHLIRRYLAGFGPAAAADVARWAGLPARAVLPVLERLRLRRFQSAGGQELYDLPGAPLPPSETPAPVRFLSVWDASLLVHARTKGIIAEEHRSVIFTTKNPQSVATFLVDGTVAGTWRYRDGRILVEPFGRLDRQTRREVDEEAERLGLLHA